MNLDVDTCAQSFVVGLKDIVTRTRAARGAHSSQTTATWAMDDARSVSNIVRVGDRGRHRAAASVRPEFRNSHGQLE